MRIKRMSRLLAAVWAVAILVTATVPASAAGSGLTNFKPVKTYTEATFTDVNSGSWYAENVESAYELNLMQGVSATSFNPNGNITVGAAITMAARLHSIYTTGEAVFVQGNPWYQVYVDYAVANGILTAGQFTDYSAEATRGQFAVILSKALPETALEAINTVDDNRIPDVTRGDSCYDAVYRLYRAGVLTGSDSNGTYYPDKTISRSAVAAIITRMADPTLRQSITLADEREEAKVSLNRTTASLTVGETLQLRATVTPADAGETVTWTTSDKAVATVSSSGLVTAAGEGSATITAFLSNGQNATCRIQVAKAPEVPEELPAVTSVTLSQTKLTMTVGETLQLRATVLPAEANQKIIWFITDSRVATVSDDGVVTAKGVGQTRLFATAGDYTVATSVTVEENLNLTGYVMWNQGSPTPQYMDCRHSSPTTRSSGNSHMLKINNEIEIFEVDAKGPEAPEVRWISSDPSVLQIVKEEALIVDEKTQVLTKAHVMPLKPGTVTLRVEVVQDPSVYMETTVEVQAMDTSLTQDPSAATVWQTSDGGTVTVRDVTIENLGTLAPGDRGHYPTGEVYKISYTVEVAGTGRYNEDDVTISCTEPARKDTKFFPTSERGWENGNFAARCTIQFTVPDTYSCQFSFDFSE